MPPFAKHSAGRKPIYDASEMPTQITIDQQASRNHTLLDVQTADYPGLLTHSPEVIAGTVLRDAGTRRDDAGVLVARLP